MIERDDIIALVLEALPSFAHAWDDYRAENRWDERDRLHYVEAGEVTRHVGDLLRADRTAELPPLFDLIEQMQAEGDGYVRELAVVGYLEDLQNTNVVGAGVDPETDVRPLLRPISEAAWAQLDQFWANAQHGKQRRGRGT